MPYLTTRPAFALPALNMSLSPPPAPLAPPAPALPAPQAAHQPAGQAPAPPKPSAWSTHVRQVYADLKATDPGTTFKQALTHARASYKK